MFRISQPSGTSASNLRTTLDVAPSLMVLHEFSLYFLDDNNPEKSPTVSSYLSLVTHAISALAFLSREHGYTSQTYLTRIEHLTVFSAGSTVIALFDSKLDRLKLPILKAPSKSTYQFEEEDPGWVPESEDVAPFVQNYFEWIAICEMEPVADRTRQKSRMQLRRAMPTSDEEILCWEWTRVTYERHGRSCSRIEWK
jgi:hypothetical protein